VENDKILLTFGILIKRLFWIHSLHWTCRFISYLQYINVYKPDRAKQNSSAYLTPLRKKKTSVPIIADSLNAESCLPLHHVRNIRQIQQIIHSAFVYFEDIDIWVMAPHTSFHMSLHSLRKQGAIIHDCEYGSWCRLG